MNALELARRLELLLDSVANEEDQFALKEAAALLRRNYQPPPKRDAYVDPYTDA